MTFPREGKFTSMLWETQPQGLRAADCGDPEGDIGTHLACAE